MKTIITKFHGPTDKHYSRIRATDGDNSVWLEFKNGRNDAHRAAALKLCRKMQWKGKLIAGDMKQGRVFVFLPLDVVLAHRGRIASSVLDLSLPDAQIEALGRME